MFRAAMVELISTRARALETYDFQIYRQPPGFNAVIWWVGPDKQSHVCEIPAKEFTWDTIRVWVVKMQLVFGVNEDVSEGDK